MYNNVKIVLSRRKVINIRRSTDVNANKYPWACQTDDTILFMSKKCIPTSMTY